MSDTVGVFSTIVILNRKAPFDCLFHLITYCKDVFVCNKLHNVGDLKKMLNYKKLLKI